MTGNTMTFRSQLREWGGLILFLVSMVLFRSAVADWYTVPTGSMKPNIIEGDRVFVNKIHYDLRVPFTHVSLKTRANPRRGEIIVFDSPAEPKRLIKRVIGVPGDVVTLYDNHLYVNGKPAVYQPITSQPDPVIWDKDMPPKRVSIEKIFPNAYPIAVAPNRSPVVFGPVIVPDSHYFVMGDNRDNSGDSRYFGFVPRDTILGRASLVVLSLNYDNHYLPRSERFFKPLP